MHQDWLCLKGISVLLLVNKIMRCMKLALKKMHFTENLKLFVSRPCPVCGFWQQQCYFRPATLCSLPKHTSNLSFIFSVQWAPVSRILAFLFNRKKIPNYLLFLAASLYTETWNYNTKVSRPTWSLFGVGGGELDMKWSRFFVHIGHIFQITPQPSTLTGSHCFTV